MGLDLFNKQVLDTYDAIIKVGDNNTLTGTPKRLSDGRGNDAPIYLGTSTMGIGITPSSGVTFEVNGLTKLTSVNITGSITNGVTIVGQTVTDSLKFTGGTGTQGTLSWNADEETLDLVNNGAVLQLGQEIHIHVRNNSVTTAIPNGTPVYVAGTLGASGRLKVAPMIADGSIAPEYFIGVTTEDIEADGDGKVTFLGKVRGFDTSVYAEGSKLYVSETVAGGWQTTEPTAPHPKLEVAFTINSNNNGTLFVRSQNGHYLTDTHDINITSVADKDLLVYDSVLGIWKNSKTLGNITTGDITISDGVGSGTISYDNGQNAFELSKGIKLQAGVGSNNNHIFSVGDPLYLTSQSGFEPMYLGASRVESTYFRAGNGFQIGTSTVIDSSKNASLNDATLTGVLKGPSTFYIDPLPIDTYGDATVDTGKVVILGDLEVTGTTTTVDSTVVNIADLNITLASNASSASQADGAGITIGGASATLTYASATDDFHFNKTVNATLIGNVTGNLTGNADTATTATSAGNADTVDSKHAADFTLDYVTGNGSSTANSVTVGDLDANSLSIGGILKIDSSGDFQISGFDFTSAITVTDDTTGYPLKLYGVDTTVGSISTELDFYSGYDGGWYIENQTGSTYGASNIRILGREVEYGGIELTYNNTLIGGFYGDGIDLNNNTSITGTLDVSSTTTLSGTTNLYYTQLKDSLLVLDPNGSSYSTAIYRDGVNPHVLMAGGGTSTQWNTAYSYSQIGHLPLTGGTLGGNLTVNGVISLPQNPVGTTYGNGVSTVPTYMFSQGAGDNDGIRMYAEAGVTNDVRYIFEVIDDIETGDTWVFRNKKTYSPYTANEVVKISGAGSVTANSFIKSGGTSSQFLKADGSVDSNSYSTTSHNHDSTYVNVTGDTMTGGLTSPYFRSTSGTTDFNLIARNNNFTALYVQNLSGGDIFKVKYGSMTADGGTNAFVVNSTYSYFNNNVGIGTTSPSRKLDVVGGFFRTSDAASGKESAFVQGGTGYAYFGNLGSGPAAFGNSENYTTLIANGGNIAIGTTSLSGTNRLEIESINPYDLSTGGNDTGGILIRGAVSTGNGSYTGGIGFGFGTGTVGLAGVQESADSDYLGMAFFTHPTGTGNAASEEKMRISASGNVGIGTTSPSYELDVNGVIRVTTAIRGADGVWMLDGDSTKVTLGSTATSTDLRFDAGASNRMFINGDSGNVGIGTTSPSEKLEVAGNIILDASNSGIKLKSGATGTTGGLYWTFNTDSTVYAKAELVYDNRATDGLLIDSGYPITMDFSSLYFRVRNNGTEYFRIDTGGNVGISTTTPFTVGGTAKITSKLGSTSAVALSMGFDNTNMSYLRQFGNGVFQWQTYYNGSNTGQIHLQPYGGNVGIGTTSPDAPLTIHNSTDPEIRFGYNSSQDHRIQWDSSKVFIHADPENVNAASAIALYVDGSARLYIPDSGNVGIGTTSPSGKLEVSNGTHSLVINPHASGMDLHSSGNFAPHYQTSFDWFTGALGSGTFRMRLDSSGNLGIGTTNPSEKLEVAGKILSKYNSGTNHAAIEHRDASNNVIFSFRRSDGAGGAGNDLTIRAFEDIHLAPANSDNRRLTVTNTKVYTPTYFEAPTIRATNSADANGISFRATYECISGEGWCTAQYAYNNNDGFLFLNRDSTGGTARPTFHIGGKNNASHGGWAADDSIITLVRSDGTKNTGSTYSHRGLSNSAYYTNIVKTTSATVFKDAQGVHQFTGSVSAASFSGDGSALTGISTGAISSLSIDKIYTLSSVSHTGYMKFMDGLLIQWGSFSTSSDSGVIVNFPTTFNIIFNVQCSGAASESISAVSTSSFVHNRLNQVDGTKTVYWMAIGYTNIATV